MLMYTAGLNEAADATAAVAGLRVRYLHCSAVLLRSDDRLSSVISSMVDHTWVLSHL
jgi:hypothetical protein